MRVIATGFTRIELVCVMVLTAVCLSLIAPVLSRARAAACQLSDSDHLRLIVQAMGVFSLANDGAYPLPGDIDTAGATIAGDAETKNTTGQFLSVLIFGGHITPEVCVSPVERDPAVVVSTAYEYDRPSLAADPAAALWDPGFSGTPFDEGSRHDPGLSNQSYAPLFYFAARRTELWRNRGDAPKALIANRGPQYEGSAYPPDGVWALHDGAFGTGSWSLLLYGEPDSWSGFAAYDDGAALFLDTPNPVRSTYARTSAPSPAADNLFVDESDEASSSGGQANSGERVNLYMRPVSRVSRVGGSTFVYFWQD